MTCMHGMGITTQKLVVQPHRNEQQWQKCFHGARSEVSRVTLHSCTVARGRSAYKAERDTQAHVGNGGVAKVHSLASTTRDGS